MAIHQARHTYHPKRPFRAWFFAIVRYTAIDTLRKQQRRERVEQEYQRVQKVLGQPVAQGARSDERVDASVLRALPRQHREVLVLTKFFGFSVAEAAEQLDISEGAVKVRVHRAIGKLRQLMTGNES